MLFASYLVVSVYAETSRFIGVLVELSAPLSPINICCARGERPRGSRAAERGDELAASHSITSSARASSVEWHGEAERFGACRLITNSNFVDWETGRTRVRFRTIQVYLKDLPAGLR
jgi:hypothetical protein